MSFGKQQGPLKVRKVGSPAKHSQGFHMANKDKVSKVAEIWWSFSYQMGPRATLLVFRMEPQGSI